MRKTKEDAAQTRQLVLDTALTVFSRKGYAATTLDDIAKEASLTRGAIYWHFKDKAELYSVLIQETSAQVYTTSANILAQSGSPLEKLQRYLIWQLEAVETDAPYRAIVELMLFKSEVTPDMAQAMRQKSAGTAAVIAQLEGLIQAGMAAGEIRLDLDARAAALAALGLTSGIISTWFLAPEAFSISAHAEAAVDVLLSGMRK
jgi:AcrR family transcriptional regulator